MLNRFNASRLSLGRASRLSPLGSLLRAAGPFAFGGIKVRWLLDFVNDPAGAQSRMTHDRGGNAMMRNASGEWVWAPHNLLTWSEDFTKSTWLKSGVTISDDADGFDLLVPASSGSDKFVYRQVSSLLPAVQNTVAIKVKPSGKSIAYITHVGGSPASACYFDLVAGTAHLGNYGSDPFIIPQDDGSYLCGYTRPSNATWYEVGCCDAVGSTSVTVNGSDGVLIKGAHLYRSDFGGMADNPATGNSYVPTTDAPVYLPRIGHHAWNGSEWVNKGLLKEGQATNFDSSSNEFTDSGAIVITYNADTSPAGDETAVLVSEAAASISSACFLGPTSTGVVGSPICNTLRIKYVSGSGWLALVHRSSSGSNQFFAWFNVLTGTKGSTEAGSGSMTYVDHGIFYEGNGWYVVYTVGSDSVSGDFNGFITSASADLDKGREAGSAYLIWQHQLTEGTQPSSPIPTNGSAATRAADVMTQPAGTLPWSASALSLFMSGGVSGDSYTLLSWQVDANNRITHTLNTSDFTFTQAAAGTVDSITGGSHTSGISVPFAYAATHAPTGIYAAVNGVALTPNETPTALADLTGAATSLLPSGNYTIAAIAGWAVDIGDAGRLEGASYGA